MEIKATWDVTHSEGSVTFELSETNYFPEEWEQLTDEEKKEAIQKLIDELPESPAMILDKWEEVK